MRSRAGPVSTSGFFDLAGQTLQFPVKKMNCIEHRLPELELATGQVREALQAILHTILL